MKNLLSVLGVAVCTAVFTGCETDAEEVKSEDKAAETTGTNKAADTSATNSPSAEGSQLAASKSTNAPALPGSVATVSTNSVDGTNSVANQEVIVEKAIPPSVPETLNLSKGAQEIVKLVQSGVSDTVILLFIEKATEPFHLDAEDIVYLNDIGLSSPVVAAMLNHDGASPELQNALTNTTAVATAPTNAPLPQSGPTNYQAPGPVQYQFSSNYIATAPQQAVPYDANNAVPVQPAVTVVEQQPTVIVQQPAIVTEPAVTYSYFYSSLSPYGSWAYVSDYGWCWQPTISVVHSGWRPYAHGGRWLYSDAGWYWHSDYSWGWAPFHYGRWFCAPRVGWVWTPDYTWGPSWVTWRRAGDYCGWAPLPPRAYVRPGVGFTYWNRNVGFNFNFGLGYEHFTFVPTRHFADRRIMDHVMPTERTANIYRGSTVVNNYIVGNNNTIVNNGISRDYVTSHTRSEIPKVDVRERTHTGRSNVPLDRVQRSGNELVVYRPTPPSARAEAGLRQAQERAHSSVGGFNPSASTGIAAGSAARPGSFGSRSSAEVRRDGNTATVSGRGGEALRPQVASRPTLPVFAKPQPLRPEPERPVTPTRTDRSFADHSAQSAPRPGSAPAIGSGLLSTGSAGRPAVASDASRNNSSTLRPSIGGTTRTEVNRTPSVNNPTASGTIGSSGVSAPSISRPLTPNTVQSRPSAPIRSAPQPATVRPNVPARSPDLVSPRSEATISNPRSITPLPRIQSVNPAAHPSGNPAARPQPNSANVPRFSPQESVSAAPQTIRSSVPGASYSQNNSPSIVPRSAAPVARNEGFGASRPTVTPIQRAPISVPSVSAPHSVSVPTPSYSAPVRSEIPRITTSPGSIGGGPVRSAPPAAQSAPPAARPNLIHSGGGGRPEGRGRVEIGR